MPASASPEISLRHELLPGLHDPGAQRCGERLAREQRGHSRLAERGSDLPDRWNRDPGHDGRRRLRSTRHPRPRRRVGVQHRDRRELRVARVLRCLGRCRRFLLPLLELALCLLSGEVLQRAPALDARRVRPLRVSDLLRCLLARAVLQRATDVELLALRAADPSRPARRPVRRPAAELLDERRQVVGGQRAARPASDAAERAVERPGDGVRGVDERLCRPLRAVLGRGRELPRRLDEPIAVALDEGRGLVSFATWPPPCTNRAVRVATP